MKLGKLVIGTLMIFALAPLNAKADESRVQLLQQLEARLQDSSDERFVESKEEVRAAWQQAQEELKQIQEELATES